ncbi:extracellular solute-binding protein [Nonomuraea dietziae]|uniref:extracellular solute-binding protein n=1 Tax=Nonomuraea dietziae TaxID=65515 RepID=UPI0031CE9F14
MTKSTRLAAAALATAVLATACSQGSATRDTSADGGKVTLRYFTFSAAPDHVKDLDTIVAAFEKENPKVDVVVETAPYDQYFTKLQTSIAGGTAPDTFELNYENFVTYASAGSLLDLGSVAGDSAPAGYAKESLEAFKHEGKQYALPASFSTVVLFYNKELFKKAGVAEPTTSWTWKDEQAAAEKLTDKKAGVFGDFQPVQFFEFYKTLKQGRRRVPLGGRQEGHLQQPRGRQGGHLAGLQGRQDHAHGGGDRRHGRLRHQPVQVGQARDVAQRHLAVLRPQGRALRMGTWSSSQVTRPRPARSSTTPSPPPRRPSTRKRRTRGPGSSARRAWRRPRGSSHRGNCLPCRTRVCSPDT